MRKVIFADLRVLTKSFASSENTLHFSHHNFYEIAFHFGLDSISTYKMRFSLLAIASFAVSANALLTNPVGQGTKVGTDM